MRHTARVSMSGVCLTAGELSDSPEPVKRKLDSVPEVAVAKKLKSDQVWVEKSEETIRQDTKSSRPGQFRHQPDNRVQLETWKPGH